MGYNTIHESARQIIENEEQKKKIFPSYAAILPWTNFEKFEDLVISRQIHQETKIAEKHYDFVFMDRSLVDPIAYCENRGISLEKRIYKMIDEAKYEKNIFFFERLPYCKDEQRIEDEEEAKKVHQLIFDIYAKLGFNLIKVPVFNSASIENAILKRTDYVLEHVKMFDEKEKTKDYGGERKWEDATVEDTATEAILSLK